MAKITKSLEEFNSSIDTTGKTSKWKKLLAFMGPAYLVSVGYMDPGNWATDIAAGSKFGYALLWVIVLSNITAILVQNHSARLGLVTGKDLAQFSRAYYPKRLNLIFWIFAEIAIAATDLAEVLGMAIGLYLLFGINMLVGVTLSLFDTFIIMFLVNKGMRMLEAIIIGLISIIGISFLIELFYSKPEVSELITGLLPSLPGPGALYIAIGIIGATVMPHNLYLHSSLVQSRKFEKDKNGIGKAIKFNFIDTTIALNLALFVNAAILILAASVFYKSGHHEIEDIVDAHKLLAPLLGTTLAPVLFAVALIASGQSSTLTGTITGQIIMEGYLNLRLAPWLRRLITRSLAVIPAFIVIWIAGESMAGPLLILSQVILSLQLGFALVPLIHWVSSKKIMGSFKIRLVTQIVSWIMVMIIVVLNVKLVFDSIFDFTETSSHKMVIYFLVWPVVIAIFLLLLYLVIEPFFKMKLPQKLSPAHGVPSKLMVEKTKTFKRIAIPLDFSDSDNKAISCAITQGGKEAEYILIHIVESAGARMMSSEVFDRESSDDRKFLENYGAQLTEMNYKNSTIIEFGLAKNKIPEVVKKAEADLLVMSSHKKGKLHQLIKGRTISAVQNKVDIPMIILK